MAGVSAAAARAWGRDARRGLRVLSPLDSAYGTKAEAAGIREAARPIRAGDALDAPLRLVGKGPPVTLRRLFAELRARGVAPHPGAEEDDGWIAEEIVLALKSIKGAPAEEESVLPLPLVGIAEGAFARKYPVTGAARAASLADPGSFQALTRGQVGDALQMLADIARMGGGRVRRLSQSDLTHGALFPYDETHGSFYNFGTRVLPPAELVGALARDDHHAFAATAALIVASAALGVKLDLTVFLGMGGMRLSYSAGRADETVLVAVVTDKSGETPIQAVDVDGLPVLVSDLLAAAPAWQTGVLIPSGEGWHPFYFEAPALSSRDPDWAAPAAAEVRYQQFALYLWPTQEATPAGPAAGLPPTTAYAQECARRKCLGVSAYGTAVGAWLAAVDAALGAVGRTVTDVVDTVEVANEPDGYWEIQLSTGENFRAALEVGRYVALLAAPIKAAVPGMGFRIELHDWHAVSSSSAWPGADDFQLRVDWLGLVVRLGIETEVERWWRLQREEVGEELRRRGVSTPWRLREAGLEWFATFGAADFRWPPVLSSLPPDIALATDAELAAALYTKPDYSATDLLHQVGYHMYHHADTESDGTPASTLYASTNRLEADVAALRVLRDALAAEGYALTLSVGEIAFPAHTPGSPLTQNGGRPWDAAYYDAATPIFQAAMYLRRLATCLAAGVSTAKLYTFNHGFEQAYNAVRDATGYDPATQGYTFYGPYNTAGVTATTSWGVYSTDGVHNDVTGDLWGRAEQGRDCWRRPSWYTFRRLVWLAQRCGNGRTSTTADGVTTAWDADGVHVVAFEFASRLHTSPEGSFLSASGWSRAYLVWVDQHEAGRDDYTLSFVDDDADELYELLPVVPEVFPQTSPEGGTFPNLEYESDALGYPELSRDTGRIPNPNWQWAGWSDALDLSRWTTPAEGTHAFELVVRRADPSGATTGHVVLAPLCILTNARLDGVS